MCLFNAIFISIVFLVSLVALRDKPNFPVDTEEVEEKEELLEIEEPVERKLPLL